MKISTVVMLLLVLSAVLISGCDLLGEGCEGCDCEELGCDGKEDNATTSATGAGQPTPSSSSPVPAEPAPTSP